MKAIVTGANSGMELAKRLYDLSAEMTGLNS